MSLSKCSLLAFCVALSVAAAGGALAQSKSDWGKAVDLKPLIIPVQPFVPPNSIITTGPALSSPYSSGPLFDPTRDQATPGLRLTIPNR